MASLIRSGFAGIRSGLTGYRSYAVALGAIGLATILFLPLRPHFAYSQWALLYLLLVVMIARASGMRPAILAATASFFAWNFFFLQPYGTFWVHDVKDWLSLLVFLVVALIISLQTGKMWERERQASERKQEVSALHRFGSALVSDITVPEMIDRLKHEVDKVASVGSVTLYQLREDGTWNSYPASSRSEPDDSGLNLPLTTSSGQVGIVHMELDAGQQPGRPNDATVLAAFSNLAAAFLERKQLQANAHQVSVLKEADRAKSAFLSAISHELKTPLTSMMATLSNMLEGDVRFSGNVARHELETMSTDMQNLDDAISDLLDLSRLEAETWSPKREWGEIGEVLSSVLYKMPTQDRARISVALPDGLPEIQMDAKQWARAFEHLTRNALAYGGPDVSVTIAASCSNDEITIRVADSGPGIDRSEADLIFDKFFRGSAAAGTAGSGLGLAITREIIQAHHGRIRVEENPRAGASFVISVPTERSSQQRHGRTR